METISKKMVIVGDGDSGKTCLLTVFSKHEFSCNYTFCSYDNYVAEIELYGKMVIRTFLYCSYGLLLRLLRR